MKLLATPQGYVAASHSSGSRAGTISQRRNPRLAEPLLLAVIGPPGAGKSTVVAALATPGVPVFRLRETVRAHAHLLVVPPPTRDRLGWVSPESVRRVLRAAFIDDRFGAGASLVLLDNFPGTAAQLDMLVEVAAPLCARVALLELVADAGTVIGRIRRRRICRSCGPDRHAPATPDAENPDRCGACGGALARRDTDVPHLHRLRLARYIANRPGIVERAAEHGIPRRALGADSSPFDVCQSARHALSKLIESSEPSGSQP